MLNKENPVAIIDSGVGGLTVVKELQTILPKEDIIYFGDNKNVPYGSKSREEIIALTKKMLDFLVEKKVKLVGIGCNTISTVLSQFAHHYPIKIIGIVDPVVEYIAQLDKDKVGLIATPFTVKTQYYNQTLANLNSAMQIVGQGCPNLAALIDRGNFTKEEIAEETKEAITNIKKTGRVDTFILGCTHYPIVTDYLQELYPDLNFINPALYQALAIQDYLREHNMLNDSDSGGAIEVFTSGETDNYNRFLTRLRINKVKNINKVK